VKKLESYYRETFLPAAEHAIKVNRRDDLKGLVKDEREPLFLLGGDEITISIPRVFEQLGIVPGLVAHLQQEARSRVAVTRTGIALDGARGHERAMKAAEAGHDQLKGFEKVARDLNQNHRHLTGQKRLRAEQLENELNGLYTSTGDDGVIVVLSRDGRRVPESVLEGWKTEALELLGQGDRK
jgi:hypothetical protein